MNTVLAEATTANKEARQGFTPLHTDEPTITVIIPALNEAANLPHVLPRIPEWVDEIILIDGHSSDNTIAVAYEFCPEIKVIVQEGQGKGAALRCGLKAATSDIVVMIDGDGSTDPREIPAFVGALLAGADFAKGSRFLQGAGTSDMPLYRQIGNAGFVLLANILFSTHYSDITYGFNATWRKHADKLALEIDNWAFEIISNIRVARNGLRVVEVASFEHNRLAGEAKLRAFSAGWQILKAMLRERVTKLRGSKPIPRSTYPNDVAPRTAFGRAANCSHSKRSLCPIAAGCSTEREFISDAAD